MTAPISKSGTVCCQAELKFPPFPFGQLIRTIKLHSCRNFYEVLSSLPHSPPKCALHCLLLSGRKPAGINKSGYFVYKSSSPSNATKVTANKPIWLLLPRCRAFYISFPSCARGHMTACRMDTGWLLSLLLL